MKVKEIILQEEYEDYLLCSHDKRFGLRWIRILFHGGYELSTRFVRCDALQAFLEEEPHYLFDFIVVKDVDDQTIIETIRSIEKNGQFSDLSQIYVSSENSDVTRTITVENFNCLDYIHIEGLNDDGLTLTLNALSQGMNYTFEFKEHLHYRTTFGKKMSKYFDRLNEHLNVKENSHLISDFIGRLGNGETYKHFQLKDDVNLIEVIYVGEFIIYSKP